MARAASPGHAGPDRALVWLAVAALGTALVPLLDAAPSLVAYYGLALVALVVALGQTRSGDRHRRTTAGLLAGAIGLLTVGDVGSDLLRRSVEGPATPALADVAYLAAYPLLAAAVVRMGGRPSARVATLLDGAMAAVGTGLLAWVFVVGPTVDGELDLLGRAISVAYPGADVLLAVLTLILLAHGAASHRLTIVVGVATLAAVVADTAFIFGATAGGTGTEAVGVVYLLANLGWAACAVCLPHAPATAAAPGDGVAGAAAAPPPEVLATPARMGLVPLAWAFGAPPVVLAVELLRDRPVPVRAVLVGSLLLWGLALVRVVLIRRSLLEDRQRLAESERHYLALAEQATDLAARHRPDGTILAVAPGGGHLLGVPDAALVGTQLASRVHPEDRPGLDAAMVALVKGAAVEPLRYRLRREDGRWIWVETAWFVVHGRDEVVHELRSATRDVARRKALEEQLGAVLAASSDVILLVASDGRIRFANDATRTRLGREPGGLRDVVLTDLLGVPADDERFAPLAGLTEDCPVTLPDTIAYQRSDGTEVLLELAAAWSGQLGARVVRLRDVTHQVVAEEVARRSQADYVALVDSSPDAIERYGPDLLRVFANPSARRRLGRDADVAGIDLTPWSGEVMREALATRTQQRSQVTDADGATWEALFVPQLDAAGDAVAVLVIARDVTDRVRAEEAIAHAATHDELTGLPNRRLLLDRLDHALALAERDGTTVAVLFLDLDRFKSVNDALGHQVGDTLLNAAARRLVGVCRPGDTVSRLGGDEFVVLAEQLSGVDAAHELANRMVRAFEVPFGDLDRPIVLTASIGLATTSGSESAAADLLRDADAAMYEAKRQGRNGHATFDDDLRAQVVRRVGLEAGLRGALDRDELLLWYQPVVELADGTVSRVEALLRWEHPERGLVGPGDFLDVVVEAGLTGALGQWVLDRALREQPQHGLPVSVNLSHYDLSATLPVQVAATLARHRAAPSSLWVEIPEHALGDVAVEVLQDVRALGVRVSLDDFGSGYASLARLGAAPVDEIKLDRVLTVTVPEDPQGVAVVGSVVELGRRLGLRVVGEGVESGAQLRGLAELGVVAVQGFLLAPPVPLDQLPAAVLGTRRRLVREQERRLPVGHRPL